MRGLLAACLLLVASGCVDRREISEVAVGLAPFDELAGIPFTALRSGEVRLWRKDAAPAQPLGLSERIGEYLVTYEVPVFDSSSSWPVEDAMVLEISAERAWPSDSVALAEQQRLERLVTDSLKAASSCRGTWSGGYATHVEFDRGDSLFLSIEAWVADSSGRPARTRTILRRKSLCKD